MHKMSGHISPLHQVVSCSEAQPVAAAQGTADALESNVALMPTAFHCVVSPSFSGGLPYPIGGWGASGLSAELGGVLNPLLDAQLAPSPQVEKSSFSLAARAVASRLPPQWLSAASRSLV